MILDPVLIRADAGTSMGTGHVMRCLALAQAWQDAGGVVEFLSATMPRLLVSRLASEQVEITNLTTAPGSDSDARTTVARAASTGAKWIVVDGYQFGSEFQRRLKDAGLKLLFIDDYGHCDHYCADLLLNQNLCACEDLYRSRENSTKLLLGARYALLRREFLRYADQRRKISQVVRRILVTLGGSDPDNTTDKVLQGVATLGSPGWEIRVVLGPANEHRRFTASDGRMQFITGAIDVPELMAWADIAICGAGITCWELLFMQVPAAVLILGENQRALAEDLQQRGLASNMGWGTEVSCQRVASAIGELVRSHEKRKQMSGLGRKLVDGRGATRIVRLMCELTGRIAMTSASKHSIKCC